MLLGADLSRANLRRAHLGGANLSESNLQHACCVFANLAKADLTEANLTGADLRSADLTFSTLIRTKLDGADLSGCRVFGVSAWALDLRNTTQVGLIITDSSEPTITIDNLGAAQFIHLLLNATDRSVIDTITSKVVLILGRFTEERRAVWEALRDELRRRDYLPVLFDFEKPRSRSTLETVTTLAHMARFVIADLTDGKSVLQELLALVPNISSVPVQPLILATQEVPGMFENFRVFPWVLEPYRYPDPAGLLAALTDRVIAPAELRLSMN
jgi:Pentapeptide repeats (8 copies)